MRRRVVVTGLGLITPVGNTVQEAWESILAGRSGISAIDIFDVTDFSSRIGGLIRNFDVTTIMPAKEARKTDPFIHYGLAAGVQAIEDSGLEINNNNADRVGIAIGSGIGGLPGIGKRARWLSGRWPAKNFPILRSEQHYQHDCRKSFHKVWHPRP